MSETWRPVPAGDMLIVDHKYEVSNLGNVREVKDAGVVPVKPSTVKADGSVVVALYYGSYRRSTYLSRLVALAFIPNPNGYRWVLHRDGDLGNNCVSNLFWSPSSNNGKSRGSNIRGVRAYTPAGELLCEAETRHSLEGQYHLSGGSISSCCMRKINDYLGMIWRYKSDDEFYREGMVQNLELFAELCKTRKSGTPRGSVRQYTLEGVFVEEYDSIEVASLKSNIVHSNISACCRRKFASGGGFVWRYSADDELFGLTIDERKEVIGRRYIRQYDVNGAIVGEYLLTTDIEFIKSRGSQKQVTSCCNRYPDAKSAQGFVWRYSNDDEFFGLSVAERVKLIKPLLCWSRIRAVRQYTKSGVLVAEHKTLLDAKKSVGCDGHNSAITAVCSRRKPSAFGYIWRWATDDELYINI